MTDGAGALAEIEGSFESLQNTLLVGFPDQNPILNYINLGRKQGEPGLFGAIGPDDLSIEVDSEVALLLQKREEWLELSVLGNVDWKEDQSMSVTQTSEAPFGNGIAGIWTNNITRGGIDGMGTAGIK